MANIELDGPNKTIKVDSGDLTLDIPGDINLDAGGSDISLQGSGAEYGKFNLTSNNLNIHSSISDGDIVFKGNDGGSAVTALTLDMSDAGKATFNGAVIAGGGNGPTLGFQLKDTSGNPQPRLTNDANNDTVIRPGASGRQIMLANYANNATAINVDDSGHVTMGLQPAFQVKLASAQAISASTNTTLAFATEIFDQNADFASNTFTAPVTGRYLLTYGIYLLNVPTGTPLVQAEIKASNRDHYNAISPEAYAAIQDYTNLNQTTVMDMDANDTVYINIVYTGGSGVSLDVNTFFAGCLLA